MRHRPLSRRDLLRLAGAGLAAAACGGPPVAAGPERSKARLAARPGAPPAGPVRPGAWPLGVGAGRDGVLYVPAGYTPARPAPLVLMLHGAGGSGARASQALEAYADQAGFLLLAPDSRDHTWDAVPGDFGPDIRFIDRALSTAFGWCAVDAARVAAAGFSDGATYALALARANGDLFPRGIAFSPGFLLPVTPRKLPHLFVSHGTGDRILPIDRSSRALVAELRESGYRVRYREFAGGHEIPAGIAREAVRWWLGTGV